MMGFLAGGILIRHLLRNFAPTLFFKSALCFY